MPEGLCTFDATSARGHPVSVCSFIARADASRLPRANEARFSVGLDDVGARLARVLARGASSAIPQATSSPNALRDEDHAEVRWAPGRAPRPAHIERD
jgi:hypothetical protein